MNTNTSMPEFQTAQERTDWIIKHVDYFTVMRRENRRNIRVECKTLEEAEAAGTGAANGTGKPCLIYAVGPMGYATYVKTVNPKPDEEN